VIYVLHDASQRTLWGLRPILGSVTVKLWKGPLKWLGTWHGRRLIGLFVHYCGSAQGPR